MTFRRSLHLLVAAIACLSAASQAGADDKIEFFEEKIRPILVDHCYKCHSSESDEPAGGLLLDSRESIREGGETGPAVVPEDVDESLLISAIEYRDLEMPPDEKLDDEIIANFRTWIQMGAVDPRTDDMPHETDPAAKEESAQPLWSLQPVKKPAPPEVPGVTSEIDRFVRHRLDKAGLSPSDAAAPSVLLRRLSFDLTGLPPSLDDISAFEANKSANRVSDVVDRLLASPQFGERWGRHWLDVVRYGESAGSSRDVLMLYAWRYRDFVIDAFNSDMPYDEFIRTQIAGDLLPADDNNERRRNLIATGLLAIGSKSLNGGNLALDIADDQIDVVGKAFMGLTVSCARCHDHKFDPIPTADYYALAGIFRSTDTLYGGSTKRPKNLNDQLKVYLPLSSDFEGSKQDLQKLNKDISAAQKKLKPLQRRVATLKKRLPDNWTELVAQLAADEVEKPVDPAKTVPANVKRQLQIYEKSANDLKELTRQLKTLQRKQKELPTPEFALAVRDAKQPKDWPIQIRGDKSKNGDVVPRGFLTCIPLTTESAIDKTESGRLQLANWLTHPKHPLTSRVLVNRVWQHLFGRGLVESVNNFGESGSKPSHPELLDWLAWRFQHVHGNSVKSLIREIVLSKTYQQSSDNNENGWAQDPANILYWRANRRRLEAEAIRDAMLFASGELKTDRPEGSLVQQIGEGEVGRNIDTTPLEKPFPHRSVYLPVIRGLLPEMLKVFDFPEPSNPAGQRTETNVPTQSLFLLNSEFLKQQSQSISAHSKEHTSDVDQRISYMWLSCLGREPDATEMAEARKLLKVWQDESSNGEASDVWAILGQSLLASAEFRFID